MTAETPPRPPARAARPRVAEPGAAEVRAAASAAVPLPGSLTAAVWLLLAQAAGLVAVSGWLTYQARTAAAVSAASAVTTILTAVLGAAIFALLAAQLRRRRRWARGPAIVLEMLCIPIGATMIQAGAGWVGVPVLIAGLAGAGLLLAPASREALGIG